MTTTRQLDGDLIDHACGQLGKIARRHVHEGMGPASAARAAIRETRALFPDDWHLAVQGDDSEDSVEVWEVEHKHVTPCARVERESAEESVDRLIAAVRARARASTDKDVKRIAKWPRERLLLVLEAAMPETEDEAFRAVVGRVDFGQSGPAGRASRRR